VEGGESSGDGGVEGGESSGERGGGGVGIEVTVLSSAGRFLGGLSPTRCSASLFLFFLSIFLFSLSTVLAAFSLMWLWIFCRTMRSESGAEVNGASCVLTYAVAVVNVLATMVLLSAGLNSGFVVPG
jgi:hypothetical protein